jgi:CoA:oxalate CoA-transferase
MGNENYTAAPSGTFRTPTGPLNIAANEQRQFETLCDLIGRSDLKVDPRFADREARKANRAALGALIEAQLGGRSAEEWETFLNHHGVPAGRVLAVPEVLAHPQLRDRAFVERLPVDGPRGERLRVTRPGFRSREGFPPPPAPPALGAQTRVWLERLGYGAGEIEALARDGVVGMPEDDH